MIEPVYRFHLERKGESGPEHLAALTEAGIQVSFSARNMLEHKDFKPVESGTATIGIYPAGILGLDGLSGPQLFGEEGFGIIKAFGFAPCALDDGAYLARSVPEIRIGDAFWLMQEPLWVHEYEFVSLICCPKTTGILSFKVLNVNELDIVDPRDYVAVRIS